MDLDKILRDSFDDGSLENVNLQTLITLSPDKEKIKDCMKEAIRQALELACDKNKSRKFHYADDDFEYGYNKCVKDSNKDTMSIMDEL